MAIGVEITIEQEGDIHIVTLDGRLDASSTPVIEKKLAKLVETAKQLVVDFSKVTYLSSAGMRLLLSLTKRLQSGDGQILFFGMNDDVMEIIKMAGFERILRIFNTKKEALKALS
ncbi:MAG: putative anti-sigma factor antagonist BtrV [Chlamydiae bacterium]|nr:putative anti-sigma factor antagonist BtrV [Chlamydiota bacterium]